ncbi:MAG: hypothetical protein NTZ60_02205 [Campylobacterales bacterium]|nr:hypothetical protein [Campylobacterales bacterium]
MSYEIIISIVGMFLVILGHVIYIANYLSRLSSRQDSSEQHIKVLFENDKVHNTELKTLSKLEAQLDILIKHLIPKI